MLNLLILLIQNSSNHYQWKNRIYLMKKIMNKINKIYDWEKIF